MKFFKCYKEIWFGIALGLSAWLVDAVMRARRGADAGLIDEIAKKYLEFSRPAQAGDTRREIEILNSIESRLAGRKAVAKS